MNQGIIREREREYRENGRKKIACLMAIFPTLCCLESEVSFVSSMTRIQRIEWFLLVQYRTDKLDRF